MSDNIVSLQVRNNFLLNESKMAINSYSAALIVEFLRTRLLEEKENFTFETVMSHPSKIEFLKQARKKCFCHQTAPSL